jgi:hypothetical protein
MSFIVITFFITDTTSGGSEPFIVSPRVRKPGVMGVRGVREEWSWSPEKPSLTCSA